MPDYHIPLYPGEIYHLFSRATGNEMLFKSDDNYRYFLSKMEQHILPVMDIFTYSLIPNHFHLLARVKEEQILIEHFELKKRKKFVDKENSLPDFIMEQFSNWLNGYAKAFNKMYDRKGSLFMDYMRRNVVKNEADIFSFLFYIHKNAVHHVLCKKIGDWKYDGYSTLLSEQPTFLKREEVISWFGTRELYIKFHDQPVRIKNLKSYLGGSQNL